MLTEAELVAKVNRVRCAECLTSARVFPPDLVGKKAIVDLYADESITVDCDDEGLFLEFYIEVPAPVLGVAESDDLYKLSPPDGPPVWEYDLDQTLIEIAKGA